ncbi:MAG: peptidoglycan DD-metalloendopeptidase family protein [Rhodocyclaceae bacterium]|nr:peptidoglycan DD-metalloendopeptidase family protein [Rhodocyclaceae bacterium]
MSFAAQDAKDAKESQGTSFAAFAVGLLLLGFSLAVAAAPVAEKQAELKDLHSRIDALRRDLARSEESKAYAADQLRETESTISDANRRLHELGAARSDTQAELADLEQQNQRLLHQTETQQNQLAKLMFRHYLRFEPDALQLVIAGRDPNQAARDYHFLTLLSHAKADLIGDLRAAAAEKSRLAAAARAKGAELAAIEQQQQQERAALVAQRAQRQAMLLKVAGRIKTQRREIDTMKRDEQRLGRLIEGLARLAAARPHAKVKSAGSGAPPVVRNEHIPDPASAGGAFAALKGKLHLPVKGDIAGRFGAQRAEGGATWKGLFIRAAEGTEVHAVAPGSVVFSDWLRGFGNLMIVDHGDGFLSVYGNNESLLLQAGETVKSGEVIATVGNSGGNPESGLYFELRHQGQAFDPLRWASLR